MWTNLLAVAFLLSLSSVACAESFTDLWKKHGGELIQPNDTKQTVKDDPSEPSNNHQVNEFADLEVRQTKHSARISGRIRDYVPKTELKIGSENIFLSPSGKFDFKVFIPLGGRESTLSLYRDGQLHVIQKVLLNRSQGSKGRAVINFTSLDPTKRKSVTENPNSAALIIGVENYERTNAPATFADKDASYFHDYANLKLGVPNSNILMLTNENARQGDVLLGLKQWLIRSIERQESDIYIFFAGHGLASDDGSKMYLLPYDGAPELLDDTAILRDRLFSDVAAANPRSVTVFLDTCYSGTTRGTDMLIASRPIAIRALEQSIPENFTVMTAAAGDQTAKPLEEAKHGMFSYFLMKGMEGEADANNDNEITAGELHSYVQTNVIQQSSGSQTPELQGDADRVLVRFQ